MIVTVVVSFPCCTYHMSCVHWCCWRRDLLVVQKISLLEIISTVVLLAMVVESSRVFHVVG